MSRPLAILLARSAIVAAAVLVSSCGTSLNDWAQAAYDIGKESCEQSRHQCDDHADRYGQPVDPYTPPVTPGRRGYP